MLVGTIALGEEATFRASVGRRALRRLLVNMWWVLWLPGPCVHGAAGLAPPSQALQGTRPGHSCRGLYNV